MCYLPLLLIFLGSMSLLSAEERPKDSHTHSPQVSSRQTETVWCFVPGGKSIVGDAFNEPDINARPPKEVNISSFSIGAYEVTNLEYANWLNRALSKKNIHYATEGKNLGIAYDLQGRILCKTSASEPLSQLMYSQEDKAKIQFSPVSGRERHPVIFVTWEGADAYCRDHNCRLPTEAEWEKAASVEINASSNRLRKYRYGFSKDDIDRSFANYKFNDAPIEKLSIKTTPVGYYNGINQLDLVVKTHSARSPYGAYDMSGNVWEWVSDWYQDAYPEEMPLTDPQGPSRGDAKVAKGGCYDSLAAGVRCAERLSLPIGYADQFTGFRLAKISP